MAVISKWLSAKPSVKPTPIIPTMWLAEMFDPKMEPATPHHRTFLPAKK